MKIENKLLLFWYYARNGRAFWDNSFKKFIVIFRELFLMKYICNISGEGKVVFYISSTRKDLLDHFNAIYKSCPLDKVMIVSEVKRCLTISNIIRAFRHFTLFKLNKYISFYTYNEFGKIKSTSEKEIPFWGRVYLWIYFSKIVDLVASIYRKAVEIADAVVVLNDCMSEEGLMVSFSKEKHKLTICCQEGFFFDNPNNQIDLQTKYLEQSSDYYLLWGEYAKALYKKYNSTCKAFVCGDPSIPSNDSVLVDNKWCIICDFTSLHKYNQELVTIVTKVAYNYGVKIDIRLHPQERSTGGGYEYDSSICSINATDHYYQAYFAHTSSLSYILMSQGYPVYMYRTDYSKYLPVDGLLSFGDEKELIQVLEMKKKDVKLLVKPYIEAIGNEARDKYMSCFERIIRD